jgi:hypothetical protein
MHFFRFCFLRRRQHRFPYTCTSWLPWPPEKPSLRRDERAPSAGAAVAGDFGGFDGAAADLLPLGNVGAVEGVRAEPGEVAAFGSCGLVERVAHARVPKRLRRVAPPAENQCVRICYGPLWPPDKDCLSEAPPAGLSSS